MKLFIGTLYLFVNSFCIAQTTNTLSWYKMLTGKIDQYPVTLHLHKSGHDYFGYYYYDAVQQPSYFIGEDTTHAGKITLFSFADLENNETFSFSLAGNTATGTWKKTDVSKSMSFSATESVPTIGFTYVYTTGSVKLRPKMKDSPEATYESGSVWPTGTTPTDEFIKGVILKPFSEKEQSGEIGNLLLKNKKKFLGDYANEYKDVKESEIKDMQSAYAMDEADKQLVVYQSPKLLTIAVNNYSYTGGAHGNYGTSFTSLDLVNLKKLALKDILTQKGISALGGLLEKNYRKAYKVKPNDPLTESGLFESHIKPNDNYFVTAKGLGFNYVPYEIGPFAMGEITIFIPFKDLDVYLLHSFKTLIQ
jgi:hypothetical protein